MTSVLEELCDRPNILELGRWRPLSSSNHVGGEDRVRVHLGEERSF